MIEDEGLIGQVAEAFAPHGPLSAQDPSFRPRAPQWTMAAAVAGALEERTPLVIEAGTGVGKTFAYLVPLLLSGRRALISTATKSLQDQLFLRDLPRLRSALRAPARVALLKGRASYLCLHRLDEARHRLPSPEGWTQRMLARVEIWAQSTVSGDLAEIPGLDDGSSVLPWITSTRDNCLGTECPRYSGCHVVRARREAMASDLVVVNHHLFFADLALRDTGLAELLPTVDAVVFDEAHQLVDAGLQFLGTTLATAQGVDLARDVLTLGLQHARGLRPWQDLAEHLDRTVRQLQAACAGTVVESRRVLKLRWHDRASQPGFQGALAALAEALDGVVQAMEAVEGAASDLERLRARTSHMRSVCQRFQTDPAPDRVRWIDLSSQSARLVDSPLDIRQVMADQRRLSPKAWVFTSATLGDDPRLSWFTGATGLDDAVLMQVGSPFDYPAQARLWIPSPFPRPQAAEHPASVGALAARCAAALGGRTFVLTTTLRALAQIAQALQEEFHRLGQDMELLVQGTQPRRAMLQAFGDGRRRVLVGSHSFWEGIDVPGSALQCVVIDKLPFPPPNDPLVEAKVRQIEERGGRPFEEYFLAEAAVSLKQGGGRLIRTESDQGLLVVCDPRLGQMSYGARLIAALPPMTRVRSEQDAMDWLSSLHR